MSETRYQSGGSLTINAPTYVERKADAQLYQSLKQGEFCYVLNSRQMGKSSLLVRTKHRLERDGFRCAAVDLSVVGSEQITPLQWYKGLVSDLWSGLELSESLNLKDWWQERQELGLLQRLRWFIEELLLVQFPDQRLFIFIDEVDSLLSLPFPIDDFFALIHFSYNQRAINPIYERITFAIFGVVTPADLIRDRTKTPFNIGHAIKLEGFKWHEVSPLLKGLHEVVEQPTSVLKAILDWTAGQPFLTQKLCYLVVQFSQQAKRDGSKVPEEDAAAWIEHLVKTHVIDHWESQDEPEHLRTIRDRIERNGQRTGRMLSIYQQILAGTAVQADDSREHVELLLSGLVVQSQGYLQVKNRIYQEVFNLVWITQQIRALRPYSQVLEAWIASNQTDTSRLLRGQALLDAQDWARDKSLSDLDYQFLAASEILDRQEVELRLEAERMQEVETRLSEERKRRIQERKTIQLQRVLLVVVAGALFISVGSTAVASRQYTSAALSEVKALVSSSQGQFDSNRRLDALVDALRAKRQLQTLEPVDPLITPKAELARIAESVDTALQRAILGVYEFNRLVGHRGEVTGVTFSPNGQWIVTTSSDRTAKVWSGNGTLLQTLEHDATPYRATISPNGQLMAMACLDGQVFVWQVVAPNQIRLLKKINAHQGPVWDITFSPNGQSLATVSNDNTLKLWALDGSLLHTFTGHRAPVHSIAFSPDGRSLISGSFDRTIKRWSLDGTLLNTFAGHKGGVWGVAISPNGQTIASASADNTIKLWQPDGTLLRTIQGHTSEVVSIRFSPDQHTIVSAGLDQTITLWRLDGTLIQAFRGHQGAIRDVVITPNAQTIASASDDGTARLWKASSELSKTLYSGSAAVLDVTFTPDSQRLISAGEAIQLWQRDGTPIRVLQNFEGTDQDQATDSSGVNTVAVSPNGQLIATGGDDQQVRLWQQNGTLIRTLGQHKDAIVRVRFSPDGQRVVSVGDDQVGRLWDFNGRLLATLNGHKGRIWDIAFSPDQQFMASASADGTVKLWDANPQNLGTLLKTLNGHQDAVRGVAISPNSQWIASASADGTVKLWRRDGTLVRSLRSHDQSFSRVSFSPDGQIIAAAGQKTITLWTIDGAVLTTLYGHTASVMALSFSPDQHLLVTSSDDRTVRVWNVDQLLRLNQLTFACNWMQDYLQTHDELKENASLCSK